MAIYWVELVASNTTKPIKNESLIDRDVHRNFEGPLLCPRKKGQHVHFCNRRRHAPSPCAHILPISLQNVKLSGSITNRRRHAPSPRAHIPRLFYLGLHEILQPLYYLKKKNDFLRRGNLSRGGQTGSCPGNLSPLLCTSLCT